jgi:hypothetical protein
MDADKTVTAHFIARGNYDLTVNTSGNGSVQQAPASPYYMGDDTVVTLTPNPAAAGALAVGAVTMRDIVDTAGVYTIVNDRQQSVIHYFHQNAYT